MVAGPSTAQDRSRGASATEAAVVRPGGSAPPAYHGDGVTEDVRSLQRKLHEAFEAEQAEAAKKAKSAPAEAKPTAKKTPRLGRYLKIAAALVLLAEFGWRPIQALLAARSVEAVANAPLSTLRAPLEGQVSLAEGVGIRGIDAAVPLMAINDPLADHTRLDDFERQLGDIEDEKTALTQERELLARSLDVARQRADTFLSFRKRQLEARRQGAEYELVAAVGLRDALKLTPARGATRVSVKLDRQRAEEAVGQAQSHIADLEAQLDAASAKLIADSGASDASAADQRADDLQWRLAQADARLSANEARQRRLRLEIAAEQARYEAHAHAALIPASGQRVWEVLVANGEHVSRGQDLMRVLDCGGAVVTANVDERVYNKLRICSRAGFRFTGSSKTNPGVVVNLTGAAPAAGAFAISPNAFSKEPYHVTISAPTLAAEEDCPVGRTGIVTFDLGDGYSVAWLKAFAADFGL